MTKVVSFSLFGDNPLYIQGAIENTKLAHDIYQGWEVWFYVDPALNSDVKNALISNGAKIIEVPHNYDNKELIAMGPTWRFYPIADLNVSYFVSRDCDSRLSDKEYQAVCEWILSGKDFHMMYDHKMHTSMIMAGMWGAKGDIIPNLIELLNNYHSKYESKYTFDQSFLANIIWKQYAINSHIAHGNLEWSQSKGVNLMEYPAHKPMTPPLKFIGQTIDVPGSRQKQR
jgi:hypothetical protein